VHTTTAAGYWSGQAGGQQALGNSDGYIAMHAKARPAVVGAASSLSAGTWLTLTFAGAVMVAMYV
jgi:hypothetical protein